MRMAGLNVVVLCCLVGSCLACAGGNQTGCAVSSTFPPCVSGDTYACTEAEPGFVASAGVVSANSTWCPDRADDNQASLCANRSINSLCSASCSVGFLSNDTAWVCGSNGTWEGGTPCAANSTWCPDRADDNQASLCANRSINSLCSVSCRAGFAPDSAWTCGGNGTWQGGARCAACPYGTTAEFNGTAYVEGQWINLNASSFTVAAWLKPTNVVYNYFVRIGSTGNAYQRLQIGWHYREQFLCNFENNALGVYSSGMGWHMWACTYDAATRERKIYRDGIKLASNFGNNFVGAGPLKVGGQGDLYEGGMANFWVWNRTLTETEVLDLFWRRAVNTSALMVDLPFNEGSGNPIARVGDVVYAQKVAWSPCFECKAFPSKHAVAVCEAADGGVCAPSCRSGTHSTNVTCERGLFTADACTPHNCTGVPAVDRGVFATCPGSSHWHQTECFVTCEGNSTATTDKITCSFGAWSALACAENVVKTAYHFKSTKEGFEVPRVGIVPGGSYTIAFWMLRPVLNRYDYLIVQGDRDDSNGYFHCGFKNDDVFFVSHDYDGSSTEMDTPVVDRRWHHYAISYDNTNMTHALYLDGVLVKSASGAAPFAGSSSSRVRVGYAHTSIAVAALLVFYQRALEPLEVGQLFNRSLVAGSAWRVYMDDGSGPPTLEDGTAVVFRERQGPYKTYSGPCDEPPHTGGEAGTCDMGSLPGERCGITCNPPHVLIGGLMMCSAGSYVPNVQLCFDSFASDLIASAERCTLGSVASTSHSLADCEMTCLEEANCTYFLWGFDESCELFNGTCASKAPAPVESYLFEIRGCFAAESGYDASTCGSGSVVKPQSCDIKCTTGYYGNARVDGCVAEGSPFSLSNCNLCVNALCTTPVLASCAGPRQAEVCTGGCIPGSYSDGGTCTACSDALCEVCASDVCSDCFSPHIMDTSGVCVPSCPVGEYGFVDIDASCIAVNVTSSTSPLSIAASTLIIAGSGFVSPVAVTLSGPGQLSATCSATLVDAMTISCALDGALSLTGGLLHAHVMVLAFALPSTVVANVVVDAVWLNDTVGNGNVIPNYVSSLTISGFGFAAPLANVGVALAGVGAGYAACTVTSASPGEIVCALSHNLSPLGGSVVAVVTVVGRTSSALPSTVAVVSAAPTVTPAATMLYNNAVTLSFAGSSFGTVAGDLSVQLSGPAAASISCASMVAMDTMINCSLAGSFAPAGGNVLASVFRVGVGQSDARVVAAVLAFRLCGDGDITGGEVCDDGNAVSGDGCTAACDEIEEGHICPDPGDPCVFVPCPASAPVDCHGDCGGLAVVDDCGKCSGGNTGTPPNANKDDCLICFGMNAAQDTCGVCHGNNRDQDACGVCHGDNSTCLGCDGVPNSGLIFDICGLCDGDGSTCLGCDGVPIPLGGLLMDACGECGGNTTECSFGCNGIPYAVFDCNGVCNGTAFLDSCSVCAGGNTSVVPDSHRDRCGVCFGGDTLLDECGSLCPGDPQYGNSKDVCGICGGTGFLCTDCLGVVGGNATYDACGVCGGNSTCGGCNGLGAAYDLNGVCGGNCTDPHHDCSLSCEMHSSPPVYYDCTRTCNGTAYVDECNVCIGGSTGIAAGTTKDRCGVCLGRDEGIDKCGFCGLFPANATADACGVCGGDNSTCQRSCVFDVCGVCDGDNSTCAGCDNVAGSGTIRDACNQCGGNATDSTSCPLGCDGVVGSNATFDCLGQCNGSHVLDACGVCSSDPSSVPFLDDCGVCFGRNRDRDSCGVCNPVTSSRDECGVCFGNNTAMDACGVCYGLNRSLDVCGDCHGNGTWCLGCDHVPFSGNTINPCGGCGSTASCDIANLRAVEESDRQTTVNAVSVSAVGGLGLLIACVVMVACAIRRPKEQRYHPLDDGEEPLKKLDAFYMEDLASKEMCFVCIRLDVDTTIEAAFPRDCKQVPEVFWEITRTHAKEEDAFVLCVRSCYQMFAFLDVDHAFHWAAKVQMSLLNAAWPVAMVMHYTPWAEVRNKDGDLIYRGPRARIGISYGRDFRLHADADPLDSCSGPDVETCVDLASLAVGGEILASASAVDRWRVLDDDTFQVTPRDEVYSVLPLALLGREGSLAISEVENTSSTQVTDTTVELLNLKTIGEIQEIIAEDHSSTGELSFRYWGKASAPSAHSSELSLLSMRSLPGTMMEIDQITRNGRTRRSTVDVIDAEV